MLLYLEQLPASVFEMIGILGFAIYVMNYALLTFQKISSDCKTYFVMNLCAASLVLIGLFQAFNLASAMIQVFWIAISIAAIVMRSGRRRGAETAAPAPVDIAQRQAA